MTEREDAGETGAEPLDVLIVGAGLVGLAMLRAMQLLGLRAALCDRARVVAPPAGEGWDTRVFAVSPGSAALLEALGVWGRLPSARVQAIEAMRVFGDAGGELNFSAYDAGERALAWIVENCELVRALLAVLTGGEGGHEILDGSEIVALEQDDRAVRVRLADGRAIRAKLLIGADGFRSSVRQLAGIAHEAHSYRQTAVVANFDAEKPHRGRAWQWFRDDGGVLALLPLPGSRVSMVWSAPEPLAADLAGLPARALDDRVTAASGHALGRLALTEGPVGYPLGIVRTVSPCAGRVVLVGDAAHGIHPLAGQGMNLGFGDVAAMVQVLRGRGPVDDPGTEWLLDRFRQLRAEPVFAMQSVTDGLWRLFNSGAGGARSARNFGMQLVEQMPILKRVLMQPALR